MDVCYRYTMSPVVASATRVGVPGIEPEPYAPEAHILPLYDTPICFTRHTLGGRILHYPMQYKRCVVLRVGHYTQIL